MFHSREATDDTTSGSTCGCHAIITCFTEDKLPMTAPVILRVDAGEGGLWLPKNFTLFFFIHPSVKTPPAPTDDSIEVLDINSYTLYIR